MWGVSWGLGPWLKDTVIAEDVELLLDDDIIVELLECD
jgi:hypothetical protein